MKLKYPSWRYHRDQPSRIIYSEAEDLALGSDWSDNPGVFDPRYVPPEPENPEEANHRIEHLAGQIEELRQALADATEKKRRGWPKGKPRKIA